MSLRAHWEISCVGAAPSMLAVAWSIQIDRRVALLGWGELSEYSPGARVRRRAREGPPGVLEQQP